jgi:hypothetical protein
MKLHRQDLKQSDANELKEWGRVLYQVAIKTQNVEKLKQLLQVSNLI